MARPKGSKNRNPNHAAGGDRRSKAFKAMKLQQMAAKRATGNIRIAFGRSLGAPSAPKRTPHPFDEKNYKQT